MCPLHNSPFGVIAKSDVCLTPTMPTCQTSDVWSFTVNCNTGLCYTGTAMITFTHDQRPDAGSALTFGFDIEWSVNSLRVAWNINLKLGFNFNIYHKYIEWLVSMMWVTQQFIKSNFILFVIIETPFNTRHGIVLNTLFKLRWSYYREWTCFNINKTPFIKYAFRFL